MSTKSPIAQGIVSAAHLRRYIGISMARSKKHQNIAASTSDNLFEEQKRIFLQTPYLESESEALKLRIIAAAKQGKYDVEVLTFPSDYCSDGGRAINNAEKDWPKTLQGKAKSFYTIWKEHGHPHGYRLKAKIIDYPNGFPGNASLYIDWS